MAGYKPYAVALNPIQNAPLAALNFGGSKHYTQMEGGGSYDPITLGSPGHNVAYDANNPGSATAAYNAALASFTPDQLLQRYQSLGSNNVGAGNYDATYQNAYRSFNQMMGRAPTAAEFAQLLPAFQQSPTYGNAMLGAMAQQAAQNPNDPINQQKSGQYGTQINQVFQSMLGRNASADEAAHFGSIMATGQLDPYQLQSFLQGTPEYQTAQDTKFRSGLDTQLQSSDLNFFNRAKQGVMSQFMQNGTGNSSALDSALTDLMGQISNQRSQYLAGLSANQYGNNQQLALSNYGNTQNQLQNNLNTNRQNALNQQNYFTGRGNELADYGQQKNDYYQSQQGQNTLHTGDYFNLALAGANTAARFGGRYGYLG